MESSLREKVLREIMTSFFLAGKNLVSEKFLLEEFSECLFQYLPQGLDLFLKEGKDPRSLKKISEFHRSGAFQSPKFQKVAEIFLWGIHQGFSLLYKPFAIHIPEGEALGYTLLDRNEIYVSPLPYLKGEQRGEDLVRGLIVHELGHHLFHADKKGQKIWKQAIEERLHPLLNLVQDEHLERNLRSQKEEYGDYLKRLASYAFLHNEKEIPIKTLFQSLGIKSFEVLTQSHLQVARKEGSVLIQSGNLMFYLEKEGSSFSRFVKALRLGKGNPHHDPKVEEALKFFRGKNFLKSSVANLWEITLKLKEIFYEERALWETLWQQNLLLPDELEILICNDGIQDEDLQKELRDLLHPSQEGRTKNPARAKNVSATEDFTFINQQVSLDFDPKEYREYAEKIGVVARKMRNFLENLGLKWMPVSGRTMGKKVDMARLRRAILAGAPRFLIARQKIIQPDLFLGILVDCSGSMNLEERLETAKLFGIMMAEGARDLPGIDLRFFGFNDSTLFDAGDANRCALGKLQSSGGNNDAGALWKVAQIARESHKGSRLLIMISDGSPTECSVQSLRTLVDRLHRKMNICCAQVAVRKLDDICFPHYVEIEQRDFYEAVEKFGKIVAKLVWGTLKG